MHYVGLCVVERVQLLNEKDVAVAELGDWKDGQPDRGIVRPDDAVVHGGPISRLKDLQPEHARERGGINAELARSKSAGPKGKERTPSTKVEKGT